MQQYADVVTDLHGNVVPGAAVSIFNLDGSLAVLYAPDEVTIIGNPLMTDIHGIFAFKAANGNYRRSVTASGITTDYPGEIIVTTAAGIGSGSTPTAASAITNVPSGNLFATTVQAAINELDGAKASIVQLGGAGAAALIGNAPAGNIGSTTVQGALNELDAEKLSAGALAGPGAAGAIGTTPSGNLSGTTVQAALNELDGEKLSAAALAAAGGAALVGATGVAGNTVQRQLDMLYFGIANICDTKFAGGADPGGTLDSTAAITAAHAASLYVAYPLGTYKKTGTIALRAGSQTIFNGANIVQNDNLAAYSAGTTDWRISGTGTISRAAGVPTVLVASSFGISIGNTAARYGIHGDIAIYNFANAGVQVDGGGATTTVARSKIDGVTCRNNMTGWTFLTGYSAEYISLTNCYAVDNVTEGVYDESANKTWIGGAITGNGNGVHLKHPASGVNPHHGSYIGVHINHNTSRQLWADGVALGMDFIGCHFFDNGDASTGRIRLENSRGINITGGQIGCGIEGIYDTGVWTNPNYGYNRISNNFFLANGAVITGAGYTRAKLIVSGNFNQSGPTIYNDPRATFALSRLSADYSGTATVNIGTLGDEIYDNRDFLAAGNFVAAITGWYTTTVNLNLLFTTAPTTEYIMFGRDDAATGTFTELHRIKVSDCSTGTAGLTASINASYDFVVSAGGQLAAFLISPGGNNFTVKAGSLISFKSLT